MDFFESNFEELYKKTVAAFPKTKARQHLVYEIVIKNVKYTPFVGMKTLFITAEAYSKENQYKPIILFKNVIYKENSKIIVKDEMNKKYFIENIGQNDLMCRCDCPDMKWRFSWFNYLDKSLYNKPPKKYESQGLWEANPKELPGMCKHIQALFKNIYIL